MLSRRAFPRIPGTALPSLTVVCLRSDLPVSVLNISNGGALIELQSRLTPGDRRPLELALGGSKLLRIAGRILRSEVSQIAPTMTYRAGLYFVKPVSIDELAETAVDCPPLAERTLISACNLQSRDLFEREICRLMPIEAARVCYSLTKRSGCTSIHFNIPGDVPRYLQIFFEPTVPLDSKQFRALEQLAQTAAVLPRE